MGVMTKYDLEPIIKTYYDALEEGRILGRKCIKCGHIEFPPHLCCNSCGGLDTEWVDLTNMKGLVKQALPTKGAFGDLDFQKKHGDYFAIEVVIPDQDIDPFNSSLLNVDYDKYDEFSDYIHENDVEVKPFLIQDEDVKVVTWELAQDSEFWKAAEIKAEDSENESSSEEKKPADENTAEEQNAEKTAAVNSPAADKEELDDVAKAVIAAAADAYEVDASTLTLATDIREDLSNESMKMIIMISTIEDELDVTIEIQEASQLNTLGEFVDVVRERL